MNPDISVIIPNHNRAHIISRAIDSVLLQSLPAKEIIVVDDGSSDHSKEFIKTNYENIRLLTQEHKGVSAARNHGIREAKGDWIALLDSDDQWLPEKLELQYRAIMNNEEYKIVHCNETWIRNGKALKQMKKHRKHGGYIFHQCLPLCAISPSSVMIHRDVISDVGFFNELLPVCEDYDMWLRICCRYPVLLLEQALIVKFGGHSDQLSKQYWGMDRYRIQALANILNTDYLKTDEREAAIKMLLKKISIYLDGARKHANDQYVDEFESLQQHYLNFPVAGNKYVEQI
ncbi:MAG: glycosyltransferase involved in cell wall biosynthesis [Gammaproteobacteria bacterium]|jgi:glycosyltransferase involved in cell wall biosynthesis